MENSTPRLLVEPKNELVFTGPFDNIVSSTIKLTNTTSQRVCFKVKTTVPKSYCVKPSSGIVEPNASLTVDVLLQPLNQYSVDKSKHKFMVQSLFAPNDPAVDVEQIWKDSQPGDLQDSKLKCVMKMPEEIVSIQPSTFLTFDGPFTRASSSLLKITNNSGSNICFKIQITNPQMFSVNPVSGLVEAFGQQTVKSNLNFFKLSIKTVLLHPWDYDPNVKYKDRFLIQWVSTPNLTTYNDSVWTEYIARNDRVLKCVYQSSGTNPVEAKNINISVDNKLVNENSEPSKLVAELNKLRQENISLRENDLRLRRIVKHDENSRGITSTKGDGDSLNGFQMPHIFMLVAFALLIGIIIGYLLS